MVRSACSARRPSSGTAWRRHRRAVAGVGPAGLPVLAERPPGRRHLAELLFDEADDPLGALRWTLAELRRKLGAPETVRRRPGGDHPRERHHGDPCPHRRAGRPHGPARPGRRAARRHQRPGQPDLRVVVVVSATCWRPRPRRGCARRRWAAGVGQAGAAVAYASRAVARKPVDEGNQELLAAAGRLGRPGGRPPAVAVCEDTMRRELGVETSAALGRRRALPQVAAEPAGQRPRRRHQPARGRPGGDRGRRRRGRHRLPAPGLRRRGHPPRPRPPGHRAAGAGRGAGPRRPGPRRGGRGRPPRGGAAGHRGRRRRHGGDRLPGARLRRRPGRPPPDAEAWLARAEALAETDVQLGAVSASGA